MNTTKGAQWGEGGSLEEEEEESTHVKLLVVIRDQNQKV
jgi:hypothetical protein